MAEERTRAETKRLKAEKRMDKFMRH